MVCRVVNDDIARFELVAALLEELENAAHVTRDRPQLEWSALLRFAQPAAAHVEQRSAEVLRLTDDARVRHTRQLVAHFDGHALQRTGDHLSGDWIDPSLALCLSDHC